MSMGKYQYSTSCEMYNNCQAGEHEGYSIIGRERFKKGVCMLPDVTTSREAADKLVDLMNSYQVDLCQMRDVTEDLLDTLKF
ncbi:hypothetical protein SDC9_202486 [bioreactor metagenome]|uniref:Uncharacterized protein n=1 Tax=bioreactor metagenome TaxID=1076179 RepID=A0A645IWK8_9ZZZZ